MKKALASIAAGGVLMRPEVMRGQQQHSKDIS